MVHMTDFKGTTDVSDNWSQQSAQSLAGVRNSMNYYRPLKIEHAEDVQKSLNNLMQPFVDKERDNVIMQKQQEKVAKSIAEANLASKNLMDRLNIKDAIKDNADLDSMSKFNMPLEQLETHLDSIARARGFSSKNAMLGALQSTSNADPRVNNLRKDANMLGIINEYNSIMQKYERTRSGNLDSTDLFDIAKTLHAKHPSRTLQETSEYVKSVLANQSVQQELGIHKTQADNIQSLLQYPNVKKPESEIQAVPQIPKPNNNPLLDFLMRTQSSITNKSTGESPNTNIEGTNLDIMQNIQNMNELEANNPSLFNKILGRDTLLDENTYSIIGRRGLQERFENAISLDDKGKMIEELKKISNEIKNYKSSHDPESINALNDSPEYKLEERLAKQDNEESVTGGSNLDKVITELENDNLDLTKFNKLRNNLISSDLIDNQIKNTKDILNTPTTTDNMYQKQAIDESLTETQNIVSNGKMTKVVNGKPKLVPVLSESIKKELNISDNPEDSLGVSQQRIANIFGAFVNNLAGDNANQLDIDRVMHIYTNVIKGLDDRLFTGKNKSFENINSKLNDATSEISKTFKTQLSLNGTDIDWKELNKSFLYLLASSVKNKKGKEVLDTFEVTNNKYSDENYRVNQIMKNMLFATGMNERDIKAISENNLKIK